jgi:hypothetical protein
MLSTSEVAAFGRAKLQFVISQSPLSIEWNLYRLAIKKKTAEAVSYPRENKTILRTDSTYIRML